MFYTLFALLHLNVCNFFHQFWQMIHSTFDFSTCSSKRLWIETMFNLTLKTKSLTSLYLNNYTCCNNRRPFLWWFLLKNWHLSCERSARWKTLITWSSPFPLPPHRRGGAGISSRLDFLGMKRGSIAAASDDSQNADDSVDGEEEATKWAVGPAGQKVAAPGHTSVYWSPQRLERDSKDTHEKGLKGY